MHARRDAGGRDRRLDRRFGAVGRPRGRDPRRLAGRGPASSPRGRSRARGLPARDLVRAQPRPGRRRDRPGRLSRRRRDDCRVVGRSGSCRGSCARWRIRAGALDKPRRSAVLLPDRGTGRLPGHGNASVARRHRREHGLPPRDAGARWRLRPSLRGRRSGRLGRGDRAVPAAARRRATSRLHAGADRLPPEPGPRGRGRRAARVRRRDGDRAPRPLAAALREVPVHDRAGARPLGAQAQQAPASRGRDDASKLPDRVGRACQGGLARRRARPASGRAARPARRCRNRGRCPEPSASVRTCAMRSAASRVLHLHVNPASGLVESLDSNARIEARAAGTDAIWAIERG